MISSRLIKSNNAAAGCVDIVDAYDPFAGNGVALYQLNGNANDVSGTYNGTWVGTPAYTTGIFGQSATFNGSSNYINIASNPLNITQNFTLSGWSKTQPSDTYNFIFASTKTTDNTIPFDVCFLPNQNLIETVYNGVGYYIPFTDDGAWHHYLVTLKGTTLTTYIDGYFRDVRTVTLAPSSGDKQTIGARIRPNYQNYSQGETDQVRIFNTALTPLEVEALYIEESCLCGGTVDTLDILEDSSCIALYPLDGNANDLSGNYSGTATAVSYGVGEFDLAGVFNGSSSIINASSYPVLTQFSFSIWVKTTKTTGEALLQFDDGSNVNGNFVLLGGNTIGMYPYNSSGGGGAFQVNNGSQLYDGNWHQVVYTTTGSVEKWYIDGINAPSTKYDGYTTTARTTANLILGKRRDNYASFYLNGSIDQLRIFNKALSAGEVTTLYNETACTPAACTSGTTNTLDILGDGSCIAAYTLDGTPADLSGNYNGVQTNVTYPQGYFDLAGSFNGTSSKVSSSLSSGLIGNFSISAWFTQNNISTDTAHREVISYMDNNGSTGWWIGKHNNTTQWRILGAAGVSIVTMTAQSGWNNLVVAKSSSTVSVYLNNSLVTSFAFPGYWALGSGNLPQFNIGVQYDGVSEPWNGSIDQVRIFNKVLSAGEVTTLYNETPCN